MEHVFWYDFSGHADRLDAYMDMDMDIADDHLKYELAM